MKRLELDLKKTSADCASILGDRFHLGILAESDTATLISSTILGVINKIMCPESGLKMSLTGDKKLLIDKKEGKNVYKFLNSDCDGVIYSSLHRTKKGAYKAMNKYLNDRFNEKRNEALLYGVNKTYFNSLYDHVFSGETYNIQEVIIND